MKKTALQVDKMTTDENSLNISEIQAIKNTPAISDYSSNTQNAGTLKTVTKTGSKKEDKDSGRKGKDPSYDKLLAFITAVSSLIYLFWNVYETLSNKHPLAENIVSSVANFVLIIILILIFYLLACVSFLIIRVAHHGKNREDIPENTVFWLKELKRFIFGAPSEIIIRNVLVCFVGIVLLFNFMVFSERSMWWTFCLLMLFIIYFFATRQQTTKWYRIVFWVLAIPFIILSAYIFVITLIYLNSGFSVEFDNSFYYLNQTDVYAKVYAYGIYKPAVREIYYSNQDNLLVNKTGDQYRGSPTYISISKDRLLSQSYNSYVIIWYDFGLIDTFLHPPPTAQIVFVPVFTKNISETAPIPINVTTNLNLSIFYNSTNESIFLRVET